jgi:hypothetical protein
MNGELASQRCANHAEREAAARCPECRRFFCRECIIEHDARVVCAVCVKKLARQPLLKRPGFAGLLRIMLCLVGLGLAWFFFYLFGEMLLGLPTAFHEGTLWQGH